MSHTTRLKSVVIRDVTALRQAAAELKNMGVSCALEENQAPRMYSVAQANECAFVLRLQNGEYDVGFEKQKDGTYVPVFDEFMGYVANEIGAGDSCPMPNTPEGKAQHQIGKFFQQYSKHAAINVAVMQGYTVESALTEKDGTINLVLAGM